MSAHASTPGAKGSPDETVSRMVGESSPHGLESPWTVVVACQAAMMPSISLVMPSWTAAFRIATVMPQPSSAAIFSACHRTCLLRLGMRMSPALSRSRWMVCSMTGIA